MGGEKENLTSKNHDLQVRIIIYFAEVFSLSIAETGNINYIQYSSYFPFK